MNNLFNFLKSVNYWFYFNNENIKNIKIIFSKLDNNNFILGLDNSEETFILSLEELNVFNNLLNNSVFLYFFNVSKKEINIASLSKKDFKLELKSRNKKIFSEDFISKRITEFVTHNPKITDAGNKNKNIPIDMECQRNYHFLDSGSYFNSIIEKLDYFSNASDMPFVNLCLYLLAQNKEYDKDEVLNNVLYQEQKELLDFIINKLDLILNKEKIEYKNKYKTIYMPFQEKIYNVSILNNAHLIAYIGIEIKEYLNKEYKELKKEKNDKFDISFLRKKVIKKWQGLAFSKRQNISNTAKLSEITHCFKFEIESFKESKEPVLYYLENLEIDTASKKIILYILQNINIKVKSVNNESIKKSIKTYYVLLYKYYKEENYNLYYINAKSAIKNVLSKFFKELIKEFEKENISKELIKDISKDIKRNFLKVLTKFFNTEKKKECLKNKDVELCNLELYNLSTDDFNKIFNEIFIKELSS